VIYIPYLKNGVSWCFYRQIIIQTNNFLTYDLYQLHNWSLYCFTNCWCEVRSLLFGSISDSMCILYINKRCIWLFFIVFRVVQYVFNNVTHMRNWRKSLELNNIGCQGMWRMIGKDIWWYCMDSFLCEN
jgi:hypothetical protein